MPGPEDHTAQNETYEISDLPVDIVLRVPMEAPGQHVGPPGGPGPDDPPEPAADGGKLPRVVRKVPMEWNRRFLAIALILTLCAATLGALWAVLFDDADPGAAATVLAPFSTLAAAVVTFYFTHDGP